MTGCAAASPPIARAGRACRRTRLPRAARRQPRCASRLGGNLRSREFQHVHGLPATGAADAATIAALNRGAAYYERLILANIERARAIPARPGGRYILVDTASARLWMIEDGRIVGAMRVVVGKRAMPTPLMAGHDPLCRAQPLLEPAARPDPQARARGGARAIAAEHLQVLSDWTRAGAACWIRAGSTGARSPPAAAWSTCARLPARTT